MTKCAFFVHERLIMQIEVISGTVNSTEPIIQDIKKCSHADSHYKAQSVSINVTCEGSLADCTISVESGRHPKKMENSHSIHAA